MEDDEVDSVLLEEELELLEDDEEVDEDDPDVYAFVDEVEL